MAMTEEQSSANPFHPGTGTAPDHLAGRKPEQALLRQALKDITGPRGSDYGPLRGEAPRPMKIVGPRGAGKTALLTWVEDEIEPLEADIVCLSYVPGRNSQDALSGLLHTVATIPGLSRQKAEAGAYDLLQRAMKWKSGQPPLKDFEEIMEARLMFRPLVLVLDEVMHYDPEMMSQILQQSQGLANDGWPLAVVLAGTPALEAHLDDVDATFMHRAKDIYINRLKSAATREALSKPFADRGVKVSDEALDLMASWTDDYPFFIQTVGSEVWKAKEENGRTEVDLALVQSVEQAVQGERNPLYNKIFCLIDNADLLEHAMKAVIAIEAETQFLEPRQVRDCMAEGTGLKHEGVLKIYNQLLDAGLFWEREDGGVRAAIPSFFTYFKERYKNALARAKPKPGS